MGNDLIREFLTPRKEQAITAGYTEIFAANEYNTRRDGFYIRNGTDDAIEVNDNNTDTLSWITIPANGGERVVPWPGSKLFIRGAGSGNIKVSQVRL